MQNFLVVFALLFYGMSMIYFSIQFFLKKEKTSRLAYLFLLLGVVTHGLDLLVFSLDQHHFPVTSLIEMLSPLAWLVLILFVLVARREAMASMGVILLPLSIIAVIFHALMRRHDQAIEPILRGGWIYVHIPLMTLSIACLFLTFVMAILYLLQEGQLKSKHPAFFYYRLPSLEACEQLISRSLWLGFFLLTFGIITGMIWSRYLRGVYWSWDHKEIWALVTWMLYALLIHGRLLAAWRGRKAAYLAILGFAFMLFTVIGVSLLPSYHSFR